MDRRVRRMTSGRDSIISTVALAPGDRIGAALANEGQANRAKPLLAGLQGDAYGAPVGLAVYFLARAERTLQRVWVQRIVAIRYNRFEVVSHSASPTSDGSE